MLFLSAALALSPLPDRDDGSARVRGPDVSWTLQLEGRLSPGTPLAVQDGQIGMLTHHARGVRLTVVASDGSEVFAFDAPENPGTMGLLASGGAWYWVDQARRLIAIENGEERWSWAAGGEELPMGNPVMWGDQLVVLGADTRLVDPMTGTVVKRMAHRGTGALVADLDGDGEDELVLGDRNVTVLDGTDGKMHWTFHSSLAGLGRPLLWDDELVLVRSDGWVDRFDRATGARTGSDYAGPRGPGATTHTTGALRFGDCIVAPRADGTDRVVRCMAGDVARWERGFLHAAILAEPVTAELDGRPGEELLLATEPGELIALDTAGKTVWQWRAPDRIVNTPVVMDLDGDGLSEVIVASANGTVTALTIDTRPLKKRDQVVWRPTGAAPPQSESTAPEITAASADPSPSEASSKHTQLAALPGDRALVSDGARLGLEVEDQVSEWSPPLGGTVTALQPSGAVELRLPGNKAGFVTLSADGMVGLEAAPEGPLAPFEVHLVWAHALPPWMARVEGQVRVGDTPVADAEVFVRGPYRTVTDADGRYSLALPRGAARISVSHPALVATRPAVVALDRARVKHDLALFIPSWARGTLGPHDLPAGTGATPEWVTVQGCGEARVPLDADGRFLVRDLRRGETCRLTASTEHPHLEWAAELVAGDTHEVVLSFQKPRGWRTTRYLDVRGRPLRNTSIGVQHTDSDGWVLGGPPKAECLGPGVVRRAGPRPNTKVCDVRGLPVTLVATEGELDAIAVGSSVHLEPGLADQEQRTLWLAPGPWRVYGVGPEGVGSRDIQVASTEVVGIPTGSAPAPEIRALLHPAPAQGPVPFVRTAEGLVVEPGIDEEKVDFAPGDLLLTACGYDVSSLDLPALRSLVQQAGGACNGTVWRDLRAIPVAIPAL